MINRVEELFLVHLDNPVTPLFDVCGGLRYGIPSTTSLSEPITELRKGWIIVPHQHLSNGLLNDSILHCRNSQHAGSAVWFRDVDPANWTRDVSPLSDVVADAFPMFSEVLG